ncbi:unnamed protein product [Paramecium primaurelia]|uniref:Uncharacterized protein n=1 Tax=Paramecium primaurelia TaxID=5886 RepID=A0A8S1P8H9_PARPR|nr:unnamed protein product [Paramecium primaurelia]
MALSHINQNDLQNNPIQICYLRCLEIDNNQKLMMTLSLFKQNMVQSLNKNYRQIKIQSNEPIFLKYEFFK